MASVGVVLGGLGLPGNILAITRISKWFIRKIRVYHNAPDVLKNLKEFGLELYSGQIYLDIKIVEAFSTDFLDPVVAEQLRAQLKRLQSGLEDARTTFEKSCNDQGEFDRLCFTVLVQEQLSKALQNLRLWQTEFYAMIDSIDILRRWSDSMDLTHRRFRPSVSQGEYCQPVSGTSHAYFGHAEWKKDYGERHHSPVLFESQEPGDRISMPGAVFDTLLYLAAHLPRQRFPDAGILSCLGYRKEPKLELIFEIPTTYSTPCTLRSFLEERSSANTNVQSWREDQWRFAHRLAAAVSSAQQIGLIHKNIRPENVLLFEEMTVRPGSARGQRTWTPFLTNWMLARTKEMLSSRQGDDDWQRNLYRHPQRQGLHLEERYHMGHDIYSLGVCLLEIGLAKPLIVEDDEGNTSLCTSFQKQAIISKLVSEADAGSACRRLKSLDRARILLGLSQARLQSQMGPKYAEIVRKCLLCVEEGLGPIGGSDWNVEASQVKAVFDNIILEPLS